MTRKHGHIFYEWSKEIFYTKRELIHPDRVFNLMKEPNDPHANSEALKKLEAISQKCEVYQRLPN